MPNTTVTYAATAGQDEFDLSFPYNDRSHVSASVAGVSRSFTWVNASRIKLSTPATSGQAVVLERNTSVDAPAVSFTDGSIFTAADLNKAVAQLLLNAQENTERKADSDEVDAALAALTNTIGEAFVPCTVTSVTGGGGGYVIAPTRTLPNNTGENTFFLVRATTPHTDGGMYLTVTGLNDGDPRNVYLPGGAQVSPGDFTAPCYLMITARSGGTWELAGVLGGAVGSSSGSSSGSSTGPLFLLNSLPTSTQNWPKFTPAGPLPNISGLGLLFLGRLPLDHVEGDFLVTVAGVNDTEAFQLRGLDGIVLSPTASKAGDYILFTRTSDEVAHFTVLNVFGSAPGGSSGSSSFFVPVRQTNSSPNALALEPVAGATLPNNTAENIVLRLRVKYAPTEGGVSMTVAGLNPTDPLQLRMKNGDQVPPGTYAVGDEIEITRNLIPGSVNEYQYELVAVHPAGITPAGVGAASAYERIAARLAASNAADARKAALAVRDALPGKQPLNANLTAFAGLTGVADRIGYFTGTGALSLAPLTAFGRSLIDDADAAAARTTLGLGTMATQAASGVAITGGSASGLSRVQVSSTGAAPTTGAGIELVGSPSCILSAYNRGTSAYMSLALDAAVITIRPNGSARLQATELGINVTGSVRPSSYTVATLPSASTHAAGATVYCSNEVGGATLVFSDGTNWRRVTDRAIASAT